MLPPKVEQKVLQGVKVVQVADCCVDHKHHLDITCTYTYRKLTEACTIRNCVLVVVIAVNGAYLGDMFQELGAGETVLCGGTLCTVVEKTEERRVQLKQSTTDKYHTVL